MAKQRYIGPYFAPETYNPRQMSEKYRKEFSKWYYVKVESGAVFDFRREIEEYCRSDVDILKRGCACFRQELRNVSGLDSFAEVRTIAQACSKVWRKNCMPEDCNAIVPPEGYPN